MQVQTRNACGDLQFFPTLEAAYAHSEKDVSVWKISFELETGERVRLVKREDDWVWEDIMREVLKAQESKG